MLQRYSRKKIFRLYHSKMNHRDERKLSRYHSISCCYMHSLALSCHSRVTVGVRRDLLYIGFSRQLQGEFTVFLLPSCINRRLSERIPDSYYSFS